MKKVLSILLIIIMLLCIFSKGVMAAGSFTPTMTASKQTVPESTEFIVTVKVSNIDVGQTGIDSLTGTLQYDTSVLETINSSSVEKRDAWTVTYSPDYSVAIWYGYDKLTKKTYNTTSHAWSERAKMQKEVAKKIMKKGSRYKKPKK